MSIMTSLQPIIFSIILSLKLQFQLCLAIPFYIFCCTISMLRRWCKPELVKLISINHYLDKNGKLLIAHNLILSIGLNGIINITQFIEQMIDKCIDAKDIRNDKNLFPEFQQKIILWFGYPFWKKDLMFDIKNHILLWDNYEDDQCTFDDEMYLKIEHDLLETQFTCEQSPWKIYIFLDRKNNCSRIIFLFHHVLGDGRSVYNALMRITNNPDIFDPPKMTMMSNIKNIFCRNPLLFPTKLMEDFMNNQVLPPFDVTKETLSNKRFLVKSTKIMKSKFKKICKDYNVPFTAILICVIAGAIRKYLLHLNYKIPQYMLCPLPIPKSCSTKGLTNAVSAVGLLLPIGVQDIIERLFKSKEALERAGTTEFPLLCRLCDFIENAYPLSLKTLATSLPSVLLSSFRGPTLPISTCEGNHLITDMHFIYNGQQYYPLIFTTLTYNDEISIVISMDANVFPNVDNAGLFMVFLQNEIDILYGIKTNENTENI